MKRAILTAVAGIAVGLLSGVAHGEWFGLGAGLATAFILQLVESVEHDIAHAASETKEQS